MRSLIDFAIRHEYSRVKALGDPLCDIGSLIDWERFRFMEGYLYNNKTSHGGRPNIDIVIMVKMLVLQHWFGLSDPELERQVADRISFRMFLGTTEVVPDFSTVWLFRDRLTNCGMDKALWEELQKQIDEKKLDKFKGTIQDASFITSDPGRKRNKKNQQDKDAKEDHDLEAPLASQGEEFDEDLLHIANNIVNEELKSELPDEEPTNEGTWAKKGVKSYFGYKIHIMVDTEYHLIRDFETTTASVHDSKVDLGIKDKPRYADKGYAGAETRGIDASMKKATRGHKLGIRDVLRNKRISKKRAPIERCFSVIKRAHKSGHVCVTTVARAGVKCMMGAIVYNLVQLKHLANVNPT